MACASSVRGRDTKKTECLKQSRKPPGDVMMAKKIFGGDEDALKKWSANNRGLSDKNEKKTVQKSQF